MTIPRRANETGAPERRSSAVPIALLLLALAAGATYSVLHAREPRHSDAPWVVPPPAIIIVATATATSAPTTEPSSCASTTTPSTSASHTPPPVVTKTAPIPTHVDPHPRPPVPTITAPTVAEAPPLPTAASDIPLSPSKAVPITAGRSMVLRR